MASSAVRSVRVWTSALISFACRSHSVACAFSAWIADVTFADAPARPSTASTACRPLMPYCLRVASASVSASDWKIVARVAEVAAPVIWSSVAA